MQVDNPNKTAQDIVTQFDTRVADGQISTEELEEGGVETFFQMASALPQQELDNLYKQTDLGTVATAFSAALGEIKASNKRQRLKTKFDTTVKAATQLNTPAYQQKALRNALTYVRHEIQEDYPNLASAIDSFTNDPHSHLQIRGTGVDAVNDRVLVENILGPLAEHVSQKLEAGVENSKDGMRELCELYTQMLDSTCSTWVPSYLRYRAIVAITEMFIPSVRRYSDDLGIQAGNAAKKAEDLASTPTRLQKTTVLKYIEVTKIFQNFAQFAKTQCI